MLKVPGKTPVFAWHDDVCLHQSWSGKWETGNFTGIVPGKSISANSFAQVTMEQLNTPVHPQTILGFTLQSEKLPRESPYQFQQ